MDLDNKEGLKWIRPIAEYGPIVIFFATYWVYGLFFATAAIMVATCIAIPFSYLSERRIPVISVITALIVGVFGGLTLWLQDEIFIKMKPTIIQVIFGGSLLLGEVFGKNFLKILVGKAWQMSNHGWKILARRFACFFFSMALLNEIIWRTQTTDFWVNFKVFGIIGLTAIFILSQAPLINKHISEKNEGKG